MGREVIHPPGYKCAARKHPSRGELENADLRTLKRTKPRERRAMTAKVSIIVPCYNEEATICSLLDSIMAQTYPRELMEVVISDGFSRDATRELIAAYQVQHEELALQVVDNPSGTIPAALNRAIEAARGEVLVRLDAHSMPYPDYVARCVQALEEGRGATVGGIWEIRPGAETWVAKAIAVAASHPLGAGDALYRLSPQPGAVDTVPFGSFRRELIAAVGKYDETLLSNEDYEFNARVRQSGARVWLDPGIRSVYFARATLGALARQYWRYGYWKFRMLRRYPETLRWRQALPPLFVSSVAVLALLGIWFAAARYALVTELAVYVLVLLTAGLMKAIRQRSRSLTVGLPLAIATMHFGWGCGFLWSMLSSALTRNG
jgi:glycosyltransferase involved in cell wall biosynthesis